MAKTKLLAAMLIFGTVGIFVRNIALPSSIIALVRGVIGTLFLTAVVMISGKRMSSQAIKKNLLLLLLSGGAIGVNWILLFEAYRYTTVATATLCYYMAPVFVIIMSALVLKERLTTKKLICMGIALVGVLLVSGVMGQSVYINVKGVIMGLGAAALYASVTLMNKYLKDISAYDSTIIQLASASVVLLPYVLITENIASLSTDVLSAVMILIMGIVHTGFAYWMYFGSLKKLDCQTVAVFSYVDPAFAILLSVVLLKEKLDISGIIGAVMILASAFISELKKPESISNVKNS